MSTDAPSFTSAVFPRIDRRGAELEREFEAARIRGYAAGHATGMRAANEAVSLIREELAHERQQERVAAERRIGQALAVRRALSGAGAAEVRELRLNPVDLETLREAGAAPDGLALTADASLARGDAVAVLPEGLVDARVAAAFDRARRALEAGDAAETGGGS